MRLYEIAIESLSVPYLSTFFNSVAVTFRIGKILCNGNDFVVIFLISFVGQSVADFNAHFVTAGEIGTNVYCASGSKTENDHTDCGNKDNNKRNDENLFSLLNDIQFSGFIKFP